jgi:hypothetical protein
MKRFKEPGAKMTLVSVLRIAVGFDIKDIELAVMLRRTIVRSLYIQMVGRATRIAEGKKYAELLDLAGNLELHGFHDEIYIPPKWKDKNALQKEKAKHEINVLGAITKEEPTQIVPEIVVKKIEELKRKAKTYKDADLNELFALYDPSTAIKDIIKYGFEIDYRVHGRVYKNSTIDWVAEPWFQIVDDYPMLRRQIVSSLKTMMKNKIKKGAKPAGMHYSAEWFLENSYVINDYKKDLQYKSYQKGEYYE